MPDTQLAIHLDRLVRRIHVDLSARAKEFDTARVGPGGVILLLTLDEIGTAPLNALAQRLVRDKSQLTREVASLERKGMVTRAPCPTDARVTLLSLTASGHDMVALHQSELAKTLDDVLSALNAAEKATLSALIAAATSDRKRF